MFLFCAARELLKDAIKETSFSDKMLLWKTQIFI
jgi:hypothetical protein